jgi:capsular exopolysaccharide synthesis family protein
MGSQQKDVVKKGNGDIERFFNLFLKNKFIIFLIMALSLLGGLLYLYFAQPLYETYSTIEISGDKLDVDLMNQRKFEKNDDFTLIETQVEILKSKQLIEAAIDKVGYQTRYFSYNNYKKVELYKTSPFEITDLEVKDPRFYNKEFIIVPIDEDRFYLQTKSGGFLKYLKGSNDEDLIYKGEHYFGKKIETPYFSLTITKKAPLISDKYSFMVLDKGTAVYEVGKRLSVFPTARNSSIIKLIYQDNKPRRAKDFLDALVDVYLQKSIATNSSQASQALSFVEQQLKDVKEKLKASAIKLENYKEENNLINIESESDVTLKQLSKYKAQLSDIKMQESAFQSLYEEFKQGNYGAVSSLAKEYPVLETLLSDLQKAKSEKITLLSKFTEAHPDVQKANEKVEDIKMALESSIESINDSLREKRRSLEDVLYARETSLLKLPEKERELADLKRAYEVNQKTYQFLLQKQAEMSINKASNVSANRVLDRASIERRPVKPNKPMVLGLSLLLGLITSLLLLVIKDLLDNKIKTKEDLTKDTKIPFYGVIPYVKSANKIFVIEDQQSIASEAMRLIRTNLEFIATPNKSKVIVVSSTVPGEGKTTVATNLAAVFGMSDKKTIVISLDMRRPMLHKLFALTNKVGMSTVLSKNSDLIDVIWEHKKIKNLDIITSGPIPPNPSELIQSGDLESIINKLREEYDYIIIDAPPMGSLTDAILLMKLADISLIVFRSEFSEKEFIASLEDMIESYKIENVGLVLNGVKEKNMSQSFFKYSYTYK